MRTMSSALRIVAFVGAALLLFGCSDATNPAGTDPESGNGEEAASFDSEAAPGASAEAFLDDDSFSRLHVEVDYMEGYEPTTAGLDSLKTALEAHLSKSSITIAAPTRVPAAGQDSYTADEVRDLEAEHRDHYTRAQSDTLRAYFLVLDGKFDEGNVVGVAYYNTSMAFFGQTIQEISSGLGSPSREKVEATVFRHEFGHVLGLVNNGTPMQEAHQDDANGAHCTNEQCVMYYAIETTDYFSNLVNSKIPGFEEFCTKDMAAQGGG